MDTAKVQTAPEDSEDCYLVEFEFGNANFCGGRKTKEQRELEEESFGSKDGRVPIGQLHVPNTEIEPQEYPWIGGKGGTFTTASTLLSCYSPSSHPHLCLLFIGAG